VLPSGAAGERIGIESLSLICISLYMDFVRFFQSALSMGLISNLVTLTVFFFAAKDLF
jgi:hypothetical protein